tara:strand:- start:45 stop:551 length:507 start_codon:yes stop_codon:yes gene_type:complete
MPKTKEEKAAKNKEWREANKEELAAKAKEYRAKNKEEIAAKQKEYREANREEIIAKKKANYEANREELLAKQKAYHQSPEAKEKKKEYQQSPAGKKSRRIAHWKSYGLICDDIDALYDKILNTKNCDECEVELTIDKLMTSTTRCMDHCHVTGLFRNVLCNGCNTKRR